MVKLAIKKYIKMLLFAIVSVIGYQNWKRPKDRLLVIMYHRILPRDYMGLETVQPGMAVFEDTFENHISYLSKNYEIVKLSDWIHSKNKSNDNKKIRCAITFDDGWVDNYSYAYPILKKYSVPATIFIVPNKVGTSNTFWPEMVGCYLWNLGGGIGDAEWAKGHNEWLRRAIGDEYTPIKPSRDGINMAIERLKNCYDDGFIEQKIIECLKVSNYRECFSTRDILDWNEIIEMERSGLIDFGSHTLNHLRLKNGVSRTTMQHEVVESRRIIESYISGSVDLFCYPNGDYCTMSEDLVSKHYSGALTTEKGWNISGSEPYRIKRIGLHEDISKSETEFIARLSGWL